MTRSAIMLDLLREALTKEAAAEAEADRACTAGPAASRAADAALHWARLEVLSASRLYVAALDGEAEAAPAPCSSMEACEGAGRCLAEVGRCTSYEGRRKAERAAAASPATADRLGACRTCGNLNIPADGRCRNCGEMRR